MNNSSLANITAFFLNMYYSFCMVIKSLNYLSINCSKHVRMVSLIQMGRYFLFIPSSLWPFSTNTCLNARRLVSFYNIEWFVWIELKILVNNSTNPFTLHSSIRCLGAKPDGPGAFTYYNPFITDFMSSTSTSFICYLWVS